MVKIKQKKQLNLPQLIEWAAVNDVKVKVFESNPNFDGVTYKLGFNKAGDLYFDEALSPTLLFTVEVEEEITLDTVFEEILLIVNNGLGIEVYSNYSINDVLSNNEGYYEETVMLILKPDPEVIWTREKGLVE